MRVLRIHGVDAMRVDEIDNPRVGPHDVLLKIDACGVCGSDLSYLRQGSRRSNGDPWPLGHEAAGTIVALGDKIEGFAIGMRVALNPMAQRDNIVGNGGSEGAFADSLLIRAPVLGEHLHPIPDSLSAERAALAEPLAVALHSVNVAQIRKEERVVVLGVGPIGLGAIYWLRRRGVEDIVAVDQSDRRLERARDLGARYVINTNDRSLRDGLSEFHGAGNPLFGQFTANSDVYFDMAGASSLLDQVIGIGKSRARIVLTALYKDSVEIDLKALLLREISLLPSVGYPMEFGEVIRVLGDPDVTLDNYISDRFEFSALEDAFAAAAQSGSAKVMVLFNAANLP